MQHFFRMALPFQESVQSVIQIAVHVDSVCLIAEPELLGILILCLSVRHLKNLFHLRLIHLSAPPS